MGITAVIGSQGHGKSFIMTWMGVDFALRYCRRLVTNYPLNLEALEKFAFGNNLRNLHRMIHDGDIIYVPFNVEYLLSIPDSVVLFDEAAIFLGDSTRANIAYLISRFNQCRKRHIELFYATPAFERTPKILRDVTTTVIHCEGVCKRHEDGTPVLLVAKYWYFDVNEYYTWFASPRRGNPVFTWRKCFKKTRFTLKVYHAAFFEIYESYGDIVLQASAQIPGYRLVSLGRVKPKLSTRELYQPDDDDGLLPPRPFRFPKFVVELVRFFLNKTTVRSQDYLTSSKWQRYKNRWKDFDLSKLKLSKAGAFDGDFNGIFESIGFYPEYPKFLKASFVIFWRLAGKVPADFRFLLDCLALSFQFRVSSNCAFIKFRKFK